MSRTKKSPVFDRRAVATLILGACAALLTIPQLATAQPMPPSISTPDRVSSRLGTLDFKDGMPDAATAAKVQDNIDFTHGYEAFVNTIEGANFEAIRQGFLFSEI